PPPPSSTLFPYTTLFRSEDETAEQGNLHRVTVGLRLLVRDREKSKRHTAFRFPLRFDRGQLGGLVLQRVQPVQVADHHLQRHEEDRKSTRLNSSHVKISY